MYTVLKDFTLAVDEGGGAKRGSESTGQKCHSCGWLWAAGWKAHLQTSSRSWGWVAPGCFLF